MDEHQRFLLMNALQDWRLKCLVRYGNDWSYDIMSNRHAEVGGFLDWQAMWVWHANMIAKNPEVI